MPQYSLLHVCAFLCGLSPIAAIAEMVPEPITVDQNWQLFLDNYIIARSTGFDRVVHHPRAMGIVIPADKPWETAQAVADFIGRRPDGTYFCLYNTVWWNPDARWEGKAQPDRAQQY